MCLFHPKIEAWCTVSAIHYVYECLFATCHCVAGSGIYRISCLRCAALIPSPRFIFLLRIHIYVLLYQIVSSQ